MGRPRDDRRRRPRARAHHGGGGAHHRADVGAHPRVGLSSCHPARRRGPGDHVLVECAHARSSSPALGVESGRPVSVVAAHVGVGRGGPGRGRRLVHRRGPHADRGQQRALGPRLYPPPHADPRDPPASVPHDRRHDAARDWAPILSRHRRHPPAQPDVARRHGRHPRVVGPAALFRVSRLHAVPARVPGPAAEPRHRSPRALHHSSIVHVPGAARTR